MSIKGNYYDNAPMERFFSSIKRERLSYEIFPNRKEAKREIIDYILLCNHERLHSSLGCKSPMELEEAI